MKKLFALMLALVLALSLLTACGGNGNGGSTNGDNTTPPASQGGNDTTPSNNSGGEEWPDNEYTEQVPTPPFTSTKVATLDDTFIAAFSDLTIEGAKSYEAELIAYGFSVVTAYSTDGSAYHKTHLENKAGWIVEVMAYESGNDGAIHITKP
jgi:hypothetical protein